MKKLRFLFSVTVNSVLALSLAGNALAKGSAKIVHDAEYYILKAQHGEKWAKEDKALNEKLAELEKKHGRKPNIVHIMWEDTAVGENGVPQNHEVSGFQTTNIKKLTIES